MSNTPINTVIFKPSAKRGSTSTSSSTTPPTSTKPNKTSKSDHKSTKGWDDVPQLDSFSAYMHHKNRKLRHQFTSEFSKTPASTTSSIFKDVVVWVNGHTKPSRLDIRRIMGLHGGRLETYLTSRVTHVVASNLATATRLRFLSKSSTTPRLKLVSPQWITDSLQQKARLPESRFPIPFMDNPDQTSLVSFLSRDPSNQTPKSKTTCHPNSISQSSKPPK